MLNGAIILKIQERINKLGSSDYDNIETWQMIEAFNKAQVDWSRRTLHGLNAVKEGDEASTRRVDDLQVLLKTSPVIMIEQPTFWETQSLPEDYLQWKRISAKAKNSCCPVRPLIIYQVEEANVDILLRDENKKPSFDWAETFSTMKDNRILIYTNGLFDIVDPKLTYYKQPTRIEILGQVNPYTGQVSTQEVLSVFKDDLVELMIDETVKILSGDIESMTQIQRETQAVEGNN